MSKKWIRLSRYHGTLEEKLRAETKRSWPDNMRIAKLKKMKLAVKDQLSRVGAQRQTKRA